MLGFLTGKWDDIPRYADSLVPKTEKKELTEQDVINKIRNKLANIGAQ